MASRKNLLLGIRRHNNGICEQRLEGLAEAIQNLLNEGKTAEALLQLDRCIKARKADSKRFNSNTSEGAEIRHGNHKHIILLIEGLHTKIKDNQELLDTVKIPGTGTVHIEYGGYFKIGYKPTNGEFIELTKDIPTPQVYSTRRSVRNPLWNRKKSTGGTRRNHPRKHRKSK